MSMRTCMHGRSFSIGCGQCNKLDTLEFQLAAAEKQIRENDLAWARNHELIAKLAAAKAEIEILKGQATGSRLATDDNKRLRDDIEKHVHKAVTEIARRTLAETKLVRLREALEKELRDMADKIEHSVNIKNIGEPSVSIVNCHIQSRYDAKLCRDRADEIAQAALDGGKA